MNEDFVTVDTPDGSMETFVASPDGTGPFPSVVIYMDAPGIREELHGFARRVAAQGYHCSLPDLYYRRGRVRLDLDNMSRDEGQAMFDHMASLTVEGVLSDTKALLRLLEDDGSANTTAMGCIGYCMSGRYVMAVAGSLPQRFAAAVSCYGVGIVTGKPTSPHLLMPKVAAEMIFAFAEHDDYVPAESIDTLRASLESHGVPHDLRIYPGTEHGFCFPERSGAYVADAAEDVWSRTFDLFERRLKNA